MVDKALISARWRNFFAPYAHYWQMPLRLLALPSACILCRQQLHPQNQIQLCEHCLKALPPLTPQHCQQCALPLASAAKLCGHCLKSPPKFNRCLIPYSYEFPLDELILGFKYRQQLTFQKTLAQLLIAHLQTQLAQQNAATPDLLIPVPLHWKRRWRRGYNQAELLARELAQAFKLPLLDACHRQAHNHSQKGLDRQTRLVNLRAAFRLSNKHAHAIQGKHIALIDDVVTTGATARALSELLRKAGARQVDIWALARTPAPNL